MSRRETPPCGALILCAMLTAAANGGDAPEARANPAYRKPVTALYYEGRDVFERNCVVCHGASGDGKGEMSPQLPIKPRSFVQGLFKYRSTPAGKLPSDADLKRTVTGGVSGTAMGAFTNLTKQEVTAVVEYLKSFSKRWRDPSHYALAVETPEAPEWFQDSAAFPEHVRQGRTLFNAGCVACHGEKGDGRGPSADALKDAWGFALMPSDLRQEHPRCGSEPEDLFRTLSTGLDGTPMPSFAETYSVEQRWDLVALIISLRKSAKPEKQE